MQLDFTTIAPAEAYRWLASTVTPRPIAWVSTLSAEGASNLAPFSFFQVISDEPPTLMVNVSLRDDGSLKDTLRNVQATGQLVIHLVARPGRDHERHLRLAAPWRERDRDGRHPYRVQRTRGAPRIAAAAVAFECEVAEIKPYPAENPNCHLIFARVLLAHVDDAVLADERHVDSARLDLVGRLGGSHYSHTRDTFSMIRPR